MFVVSGDNHYYWNISAAKLTDYLKAAHNRHLKVEEDQIWMELLDLPQAIFAVIRFPDDVYIGHTLQFFPQDAPRDFLVVDDQGLQEGTSHSVVFTPNVSIARENSCERALCIRMRVHSQDDRNGDKGHPAADGASLHPAANERERGEDREVRAVSVDVSHNRFRSISKPNSSPIQITSY